MNDKLVLRFAALVSAISGGVILFSVIYPIVSYEATAGRKYPTLINPLSGQGSTTSVTTNTNPVQGSNSTDYTNPQNWFVGAEFKPGSDTGKVAYYSISIPKLEIQDVTVEVGGLDLGKSLVQYPGTAVPGKLGNAVIFGHSILPQFYNPKSYLSVFSLLPTLEKGDYIEVKFDGVTYKYAVETMFEVHPTDIQVLDQQPDSSYLTLVTCVPPGHPLKPKRLIVRAKILSVNKGLAPAEQ